MKTAFFAAKTLNGLPSDNFEALAVLCGEFDRFDGFARQLPEHHNDYVEALSILRGFAMAREAKLLPFPDLGSQRHQNISKVTAYFGQLRTSVREELTHRYSQGHFDAKTEEYIALFSGAVSYEFSETDFKRVQDLITQLRDLIHGSTLISDDHKRRLLRRLDAMHGELRRKTNDIDRFWGFIGEAGIAMRKFGEDLAPISERVLELGGIVVNVIFAKEGIKALPEVSQIVLPNK
jgi:hypothetical protein